MSPAGRPFGRQPAWHGTPDFPDWSWTHRAACAGHGHNDWFVDDPAGNYTAARAVCDRCIVKPECLAWAIDAKIVYGMWGGLNPTERERITHRLRRQAGHTRPAEWVWVIPLVLFIVVGLRLLGLAL